MNVLKSGEQMLRRTILSGRFTPVWTQPGPLSHNRPAPPHCRNCTVSSFKSRRTLQEHNWTHGVRYLCQQETLTQEFKEHCQAPAVVSSSGDDDLSKIAEVKVPLYRKLQECLSPSDVLDLMESNSMAYRHISNCVSRMWETTKKMSDDQRCCELSLMMEHPSFQKLCHKARVNAPYMSTNDLAYTLLGMVKLGISQSSLVVQTLLRVIQERLNQFDEKSLSVLSSCLKVMESSKNAEALKQGLKLILEDRIPEIQNVLLLQTMMRLLGKDASPAIKKQLEMKALSMADTFTLPNAQYMLLTLATMHLNSKPLLDMCSKKLAENVHGVPYNRLLMMLKSCRELHYRNYSLLLSISEYLATTLSMWTNKQVIFILLEFERLRFCPVALLNAFAMRVIQKADSLALKDLLSILKIYSSLNHDLKEHKQEFLAGVTGVLVSYLPKMSTSDLLRAISSLSVLEHFPQALLKKLLQKECLDELIRGGSLLHKGVEMKLHMLGLCLRLDNPPLPPSVSPIPDLHGILSPYERPVNPGLISALQSLVGETAVMDCVVEEKVYFIDIVITLSEAKDIFSSPEVQPETSPKSRRIAVLCAPPSSFCYGTTHPRGSLAVKIRHLKLLGYEPCLIPVHELNSLPEQQRTEVLRNIIFPEGGRCRVMEERDCSEEKLRPGQMSTP